MKLCFLLTLCINHQTLSGLHSSLSLLSGPRLAELSETLPVKMAEGTVHSGKNLHTHTFDFQTHWSVPVT
jgi:hypothetical protein